MATPQQTPNTIFHRNPVTIMATVQAAITLGLAFGLKLSGEQIGAIVSFVGVLIALYTNTMVVATATANAQVNEALFTPVPTASEKAEGK